MTIRVFLVAVCGFSLLVTAPKFSDAQSEPPKPGIVSGSLQGTSHGEGSNSGLDVSVVVSVKDGVYHFALTNREKTDVTLWAVTSRSNRNQPTKFEIPTHIASRETYSFLVGNAEAFPKTSEVKIPFNLYLLNADGKQYVVDCFLSERWGNGELKTSSSTTSVKQEQWPANIQPTPELLSVPSK